MIGTIMLLWLLNQLFILIIMLNFLIAVITQTYDQVTQKQKIFTYNHRADLNVECRQIYQQFSKMNEFNCIQLQTVEDEKKNDSLMQSIGDDHLALIDSIKTIVSQENEKLQKKVSLSSTKVSSPVNLKDLEEKLDNTNSEVKSLRAEMKEIKDLINKKEYDANNLDVNKMRKLKMIKDHQDAEDTNNIIDKTNKEVNQLRKDM